MNEKTYRNLVNSLVSIHFKCGSMSEKCVEETLRKLAGVTGFAPEIDAEALLAVASDIRQKRMLG